MTKLDYADKEYKDIKESLDDEYKKGRAEVEHLLNESGKPAEGWAEVVENYTKYSINAIKLMGVRRFDKTGTYQEQFMLTFENNKTMFVYMELK